MKIEVKNIKFYEKLSEETNCFTADVFINGTKVAYAKNDGQGGSTFYHPYDIKYRQLLEEAEAYAKTLPEKSTILLGATFTYKQTLESLIDDACTDKILEQSKKKFEAKKVRDMQYGILVSTSTSEAYSILRFKGTKTPLSKLSQASRENLLTSVKNQLKPGEKIINTNLEALGLKL